MNRSRRRLRLPALFLLRRRRVPNPRFVPLNSINDLCVMGVMPPPSAAGMGPPFAANPTGMHNVHAVVCIMCSRLLTHALGERVMWADNATDLD